MRRPVRQALAALLALAATAASAGVLRYCDPGADLTAAQKDVLLRVAARVKQQLEASGARVALVSRSGLDLSRFGARYSHTGVALAAHPLAPWAVRQLYYACDEQRPRLFDQGIAGFLLGTDRADLGYVSLLLLPEEAAAPLQALALDDARGLSLLGARYSANAYPFSERYQNCNQWVAELLALAWGGLAADGDAPRRRAQRWLREAGYQPTPMAVNSHLTMFVAGFVPWVHADDHPEDARWRQVFEVSMPTSLEAFARQRWPGARRIELCHAGARIVLRRDGAPLAEGCVPEAGDELIEPGG